jgi:hypothetical protein
MAVEGDAVANASQQIGERRLAVFERSPAEILAVELDQVECTQHDGMVAKPIAEHVKHREAALVDHDRLAVERA